MSTTLSRLRDLIGRDGQVDYSKAKALARDHDPLVRRELAQRTDLAPEILYFMAEDEDAEVRRAIAQNQTAPAQADLLLTKDTSVAVRSDLAAKIARLAPGLNADQLDRVKRITYQVVKRLAADQLVQVREILSDILKDVVNAPPEVIKRLAHDVEITVAGPVLEFSPVLTDDDLLEVIRTGPNPGSLSAISRRSRLGETVSDAIVDTDEVGAITELLTNSSAQIREETLDQLVDKAPSIPQWHAPLTRRPHLSSRTTIRLAKFVAQKLVAAMLERHDLDPETAAEVSRVVEQRIEEEGAEPLPGEERELVEELGPEWERGLEAAYEEATARIEGAGAAGLGEEAVLEAMNSGNAPLTIAFLAALAGINVKITNRIIESQSGKAMLGLCWKAGLSCGFAVQAQTKLARIVPEQTVKPKENGAYPLSDEELDWQLELFTG